VSAIVDRIISKAPFTRGPGPISTVFILATLPVSRYLFDVVVSSTLLLLTGHRWNVPVVAHLGRTGAAPFGEIVAELRVSRDSLSRTLGSLAAPGWVGRENRLYTLTQPGIALAPPCAEILDRARRRSLESVVFKKWSLPVAAALMGWSLRFAELRAMLGDITPRALTLALKEMQAAGLVSRKVIGGFPPSTSYRLTRSGETYLPALAAITGDGA